MDRLSQQRIPKTTKTERTREFLNESSNNLSPNGSVSEGRRLRSQRPGAEKKFAFRPADCTQTFEEGCSVRNATEKNVRMTPEVITEHRSTVSPDGFPENSRRTVSSIKEREFSAQCGGFKRTLRVKISVKRKEKLFDAYSNFRGRRPALNFLSRFPGVSSVERSQCC